MNNKKLNREVDDLESIFSSVIQQLKSEIEDLESDKQNLQDKIEELEDENSDLKDIIESLMEGR